MNTPIINPFMIYLVYNIDSLINILIVSTILSITTLTIYYIARLVCCVDFKDKYQQWLISWKKVLKYGIVTLIISITLLTFIPNKNTLIAMYVANQITYARVEKTMNAANNIKDVLKKDVLDIIEGITKNQEQSNTKKGE
jgi:hypothetical protein